jgi:hypothetical protein
MEEDKSTKGCRNKRTGARESIQIEGREGGGKRNDMMLKIKLTRKQLREKGERR